MWFVPRCDDGDGAGKSAQCISSTVREITCMRTHLSIRRLLVVLMCLVCAVGVGLAQQVNATLFVQPFPPPYQGEWQTNPSIGYLTVTNTSSNLLQVVFDIRITRRATGSQILAGSSSLQTLPPGTPSVFNNTQFLDLNNVTYDASVRSQIIRSGRIPEGEYIACLDIREPSGNVLLRNVCSQVFTIVYPDPPFLVTPMNGDTVSQQFPIFSWTPVTVPPAYTINYQLRIVEVFSGQVPAQALAANTPPHYENLTLTTTNLLYPVEALAFQDGKRYAWQIQVVDQNGYPPTSNNGRSQIFTFVYRRAAPPPPPPPITSQECLLLAAHSPEANGRWTTTGMPKFIINVQPAVNFSQLRQARLRVWRMNDSSEAPLSVTQRTPVLLYAFNVSASTLLMTELDTSTSRLEVRLDTTQSGQSFRPDSNVWYLWKFDLKYNPVLVRRDTVECVRDSVTSAYFKFKYEPRPATAAGECRDVCSVPAPSNQTPATFALTQGDTLRVGRFSMILTEVSGSAASLSGRGQIKIPLFRALLQVRFSGLRVNALKEVYDGDVTAQQAQDSPLSEAEANALGTALNLTPQQINAIHTLSSQGGRLVSSLLGTTPLTLPIGLDNEIAGQRYVVGIIGMVFKPTGAYMNMAMSYPIPEWGPGIAVSLGARNICFSPTGIGGDGNVQLYLPSDIGYMANESWGFKFLASTSGDSGCYVTLDCRGFKDLRLSALVEFPRAWLRPFPTDDGVSRVKATFTTHIARGGNFLAAANLDRCEIASAPGFVLEVQEMTLDFSDEQNPVGIVFPPEYVGVRDETWKGFYIKRASVSLPPQLRTFDATQPPQIAVQNLLITRAGVTGSFRAENVFMYPRGNFGDWGGSLDTLAVEVVSSSLRSGWMKGKIKMPISETPMLYSATLSRPGTGDTARVLRYAFVITPGDTFDAALWAARIKLFPTSNITISNDNPQRRMQAVAILNGSLSIAGTVGGVPDVKLPGIGFQNMKLQSVRPYFTKGTFSFASPEKGVAGFPLSISNIDMENTTRQGKDLSGVKFTINVNLAPGSNSISGGTTLKLWGELDLTGPGQKFKFHSLELDSIGVNADLGPVRVNGFLKLYRDDPTFGSGFRGAVRADILQRITITSTVQFGKVSGFRYFYVDAKGVFSPGIAFGTTGVGFYGLGGGFWYNMRREGPATPPVPTSSSVAGPTPGATVSGFRFVPSEGTFGFKAMVVLGTHPSPVAFNSDVVLEIELQRNPSSGSLSMNRITFQGSGYMMADISARQNAKVTMFCDITYNFPQSTFHGVFNVTINATPVTGNGQTVLHVEPTTWYINIGEPNSRFNLRMTSWLQTQAYLMMGRNLPPPPPPPEQVRRVIGSPSSNRDSRIAAGSGFAFGASISFSTGRVTYSIFYGEVSAGGGFDIAVLKQTRCTGINGWQAQGQLYAWVDASVGLYVDVGFWTYKPCGPWYCYLCKWCRDRYVGYRGNYEILRVSAAALLEAGGPNPLWIKGTIAGNYSILGGLVSGHCSFQFSKGTECRI